MELKDYVADFLGIPCDGCKVPGCVDITNYRRSIKIFTKADTEKLPVELIHDNPTRKFNVIFMYLTKRWTTLSAEAFPECTKNMSDGELSFLYDVPSTKLFPVSSSSTSLWKMLSAFVNSSAVICNCTFDHLFCFSPFHFQ